jgi:hypothetical protein
MRDRPLAVGLRIGKGDRALTTITKCSNLHKSLQPISLADKVASGVV